MFCWKLWEKKPLIFTIVMGQFYLSSAFEMALKVSTTSWTKTRNCIPQLIFQRDVFSINGVCLEMSAIKRVGLVWNAKWRTHAYKLEEALPVQVLPTRFRLIFHFRLGKDRHHNARNKFCYSWCFSSWGKLRTCVESLAKFSPELLAHPFGSS